MLNVMTFGGAVGDGITDDTAAVQRCLNAIGSNGGIVCFPPDKVFKCGNLLLSNKSRVLITGYGARIQWTGTAPSGQNLGLQYAGVLEHITIEGLEFVGDGVVGNGHAGIWCLSGQNIKAFTVKNCRFLNVELGVSLNADLSGSVFGAVIEGNYLENIVGVDPGQGYGIHHASYGYTHAGVKILGNTIIGSQRHAIYQARGRGVVISGNTIRNHRSTVAAEVTRSAIEVTRSRDVVVTENVLENCYDVCLQLKGGGTSYPCENIVISKNYFNQGNITALFVGHEDPAASGTPEGVVISDNIFYSNGLNQCLLRVYHGKRIKVANNVFRMLETTSTANLIEVYGQGESCGALYTDDVEFNDNLGEATGSTVRGVRLERPICTAGGRVSFRNNRFAVTSEQFSEPTHITNPNLYVDGAPLTGIALSGVAPKTVTGNDTISAGTFGVKGDGVTNDAPSIQAAIEAAATAGGGVVYLPRGTYLVATTLQIKSKVVLRGAGRRATVIQAGTAGMNVISNAVSATGWGLEHLGVKGTNTVNIVERGVYVSSTSDVRVSHCWFEAITFAVQAARSNWVSVLDCAFFNVVGTTGVSEGYGVLLEGGGDHLVRGCRFDTIQRHAVYLSAGCSRSVVAKNRIRTVRNVGIQVHSLSPFSACVENVIAKNIITAITAQPAGQGHGIVLFRAVKDTLVDGNVISGCADHGIMIEVDSATSDVTYRPARNIIRGNRIKDVGIDGVHLKNTDETLVAENDISGNASNSGVHITTAGTDAGSYSRKNRVIGNAVTDVERGVYPDNSRCEDNVILGNAFHNCASDIRDDGANTRMDQRSKTAALDFPSIAGGSAVELTIGVPGAVVGDDAVATPSSANSAPEAGLVWSAYVSAANTVTVRLGNVSASAVEPASRPWRVSVFKPVSFFRS